MKSQQAETSPPERPSRAWIGALAVPAVLLAVTLLVRLPDLGMPLERDEGEYAYAAQDIARGGMPYRDSFCQKPPVVFFWYLGGIVLFGQSVEAIHLAMVAAAAAAALGLYYLGKRLSGRTAGWLAALVFSMAAAGSGYFGSAANTEIFMLAPAVAGALLLLRAVESEKPVDWFLTGLFFGLAFMTKQVALFSFAGPGFFAAWILWKRRRPASSHLKPALFGTAGAAAAVLPFVIWFSLTGTMGHFWDTAFSQNVGYVDSPYGAWKWEQMADVFWKRFCVSDGLLYLCTALLLLLVVMKDGCRRKAAFWFPLLWFAGSVFGVALGPYTFGHYFLQMLPAAALAMGVLVEEATRESKLQPRLTRFIPLAAGLLVMAPMLSERLSSAALSTAERSFELYKVYGHSPFQAAVEVGDYLRKTTDPGDTILIVGSEPEILFYANRKSATRFTIFYPLLPISADTERSDALCREFFREIEENPPKKIVITSCPSSFITGGKSTEKLLSILSRIYNDLLAGGYDEEDQVFLTSAGDFFWRSRLGKGGGNHLLLFQIYGRTNH